MSPVHPYIFVYPPPNRSTGGSNKDLFSESCKYLKQQTMQTKQELSEENGTHQGPVVQNQRRC